MNKLLATTALIALTIAGAAHADTTGVITPVATPTATLAPATTASVDTTKANVQQGIVAKKDNASKSVTAKKNETKGIVIAKKEDTKIKASGKVDEATSSVSNSVTTPATK